MKNVFVTIVQKSFRTDRLEMTERLIVDGDGFDPVNRVLEDEIFSKLHHNFVRKHWVRWSCANIEEKRAGCFQEAANLTGPFATPCQIIFAILAIGISAITHTKIVGRRCDDEINGFTWETHHSTQAIRTAEPEPGHS